MAKSQQAQSLMKAPVFWHQPIGWQSRLLMPVSWLFRIGGLVRRLLAVPYRAKISVTCVGNIIAGGAGKTPTCIALADLLLQQGAKPVFVTRGYGGNLRNVVRVDPSLHNATDVGDEALLLTKTAPVFIGRDRVRAIKAAEHEATHIIMDDGLQNPHVKPHHSFLVLDSMAGIGNGLIIPAGPLRENLAEAQKRVDAVILVGQGDTHDLARHIHKPLIHAQIHPVPADDFDKTQAYLAFAGIGRPEKFYQTCRDMKLNLAVTEDFPDHHMFSEQELHDLQQKALALNAQLLTTEKDRVRLPPPWQEKIKSLPVKLVFDIPELPKSFLATN